MLDWSTGVTYATSFHGYVQLLLLAYVPSTLIGQYWMRSRTAFDLRGPLRCWNALLSIVSILGFGMLVQRLGHVSFLESLTQFDFTEGWSGGVVCLFNVSKLFELVDTVFLILRKKPVGFLHVFHHITVASYCWYTLWYPTTLGYWFALMNLFVHGPTSRLYRSFDNGLGYPHTISFFVWNGYVWKLFVFVLPIF